MKLAAYLLLAALCLDGTSGQSVDIGFEALLVTARPTPEPAPKPTPTPPTEEPTESPPPAPTDEPTKNPTFEPRDIPTTEDVHFLEQPTPQPTHHHKKPPRAAHAKAALATEGDCLLTDDFLHYGSKGLFAMKVAFFGLFFSSAFFAYAAFDQKSGFRFHHFRVLIPALCSALTYLSMSQGLGIYSPTCGRQIFWARYIDWGLTTPIMLYEICSLAYVQSENRTRWLLGTDFLMVLCGFIGCWLDDIMMCVYLAIGIMMFLPAVYYLLANDKGLREGTDNDSYRSKLIKNITSWTFIVWTCYPVVWSFCSGLEYFSVDSECIAYTVLDILAKISWGFMIVNSPAALAEVYGAQPIRINVAQSSPKGADPMLEEGSML